MRFRFISAWKAVFTIRAMCRVLEVSRQGYFQFVKRQKSTRELRDAELLKKISEVHTSSRETYGVRRVTAALQAFDDTRGVGRRRVARLMRAHNLRGFQRKSYRTTTVADLSHRTAPNTLDRQFQVDAPNRVWVTDITYIRTYEGWAYLAVVLDLYARRVVGWSVDKDMSTTLVTQALLNARQTRGCFPHTHHSDRGCQYTSNAYRAILNEHAVTVSMSRKGNCWDNAVAESFFATLKRELVDRYSWPTRQILRDSLFEYIELFYNRIRLHSTLGYMSPAEYESQSAASAA